MTDSATFQLPPSATPLTAAELNALRFNGKHTLLTPEKLEQMAAAEKKEGIE